MEKYYMIKNYKQFESLLDKLQGPSEEEVINSLKDSDPFKLYQYAYETNNVDLKKYAQKFLSDDIILQKIKDLSCFIVDISAEEKNLEEFGIPGEYWTEFEENLNLEKNKELRSNAAWKKIYNQVIEFFVNNKSLDDICECIVELDIKI